MVIPKKKRMNEAIGPESPRMFVRNGTIRAHRSSSQSQSTPECPCLARLVGEHVSHRIYEVVVYKREPCRLFSSIRLLERRPASMTIRVNS